MRWRIKESHWYAFNHTYGWAVPIVASALLFWHGDRHFNVNKCFLERESTGLFLYTPISVILAINVVLFIWSAWGIHRTGQDVSPDKRRALAYKYELEPRERIYKIPD